MGDVKFIEKSHRYLSDEGELVSVSKFFDRFKPVVNWNKIAGDYAKKNGLTKKEVLDKWENKRNKSSEIGTLLHSIKEQELIERVNPQFYNVVCNKKQCTFQDGFKYSIPISNIENNTVYPELMIYDKEYMICGQSDKVIVVNNTINIWDYKTDKEIKFKGYSNQWMDARKLLKPLQHLDDEKGNHYAIKMSLYMYLLWKANKGRYKPGEIILEHLHLKRDPENDDLPILIDGKPVVTKVEYIKLPYLKKEVMAMLKTIK